MSLSELVSSAGLAFFPQVAMIIFLGVFAAVVVRLYASRDRNLEACGRLPLDEAPEATITNAKGADVHGQD